MSKIMLTNAGQTISLALPMETAERLGLRPGQEMLLTELPDGVQLTRVDADLERQLSLVDRVLDRHDEGLRLLASR